MGRSGTIPRCFLVTVGNSLIVKVREHLERKGCYLDSDFLNPREIEDLQYHPGDWEEKKWKNSLLYKEAVDKIKEAFENRGLDFGSFIKLSAELSSLYHIKPRPGRIKGDKVILFATCTPTGYLCANLLKWILEEVEIKPDKVKLPCVEIILSLIHI